MENSKSLEVEVNGNNFQKEVLESSIPVLVDFWASWCMPCRMLAPTIKKLAEENKGKLKVCKLNTDENQHIAAQYGIQGIPTLIIFKEGKEVGRSVGVMSKEKLQEKLNPIL
ncbi:thioredoxin [Candidatus Atribacteria bacterium RBG_19FT_COMBO_35_14]|uniref:Thioredoxin n=1 Tax=Candidatus Sediminicultor quintus TaxID=1797291 RepID=A0A1F5AB43_9BACT|nr:MAG: thioredoxin [Candidatus Atribacteria bacterium RBG_19FT_COMBO_35_14]